MAKVIGKGKPDQKGFSKRKITVKKPNNSPTLTKKQKGLHKVSLEALTAKGSLHGIWLVRQGLRSRSEQYMAIAKDKATATMFCRHYLTPRYCSENDKFSLKLVINEMSTRVNYGNNQLLIKGLDFTRQEEGRTNQSPLWYWVIAPVPIVKNLSQLKLDL